MMAQTSGGAAATQVVVDALVGAAEVAIVTRILVDSLGVSALAERDIEEVAVGRRHCRRGCRSAPRFPLGCALDLERPSLPSGREDLLSLLFA